MYIPPLYLSQASTRYTSPTTRSTYQNCPQLYYTQKVEGEYETRSLTDISLLTQDIQCDLLSLRTPALPYTPLLSPTYLCSHLHTMYPFSPYIPLLSSMYSCSPLCTPALLYTPLLPPTYPCSFPLTWTCPTSRFSLTSQ